MREELMKNPKYLKLLKIIGKESQLDPTNLLNLPNKKQITENGIS